MNGGGCEAFTQLEDINAQVMLMVANDMKVVRKKPICFKSHVVPHLDVNEKIAFNYENQYKMLDEQINKSK